MRIVILTGNNIYSPLLLEPLIKAGNHEVVALVVSASRVKRSVLRSAWNLYRLAGARLFVSKALLGFRTRVLPKLARRLLPRSKTAGKWHSLGGFAQHYGIQLLTVDKVNGPEALELLRSLNPTLIISAYFNQILRREALSIPERGCINIHPSYLPELRGVQPTFWALAQGYRTTGVTVHWMDEGIDTGKPLLQKEVEITRADTLHSLDVKCSAIGGQMLASVLQNDLATSDGLPMADRESSYVGIPTAADYAAFRRQGRRLG